MTWTNAEARIGEYVDAHAEDMVRFLQTVVATPSIWGNVPALARLAGILGDYLTSAGAHVSYCLLYTSPSPRD